MSSKNVGRGNFTEDYEITIELAKLITLNSRSIVKQRYAQWLYLLGPPLYLFFKPRMCPMSFAISCKHLGK